MCMNKKLCIKRSDMKLKVWIKSKAADKVLAPLRKELLTLIDKDSSLYEVGCGTGDFMLQSASIITHGYGVDLDNDMISYAEERRQVRNLNHINFKCIDALKITASKYDIAISTLCLHELSEQDACDILKMMLDKSQKVIIADYTEAKSLSGKLIIELDELLSGHYGNFKKYRSNGGIPSYAAKVGAIINKIVASAIDGISIWVITGKANA